MKYVRVTIRRNRTGDPVMVYPDTYNPREVDRNRRGPLVYDESMAGGADTEEMLMFIEDTVADRYAQHRDMDILTEGQADVWLSNNPKIERQPTEVVTDANRLVAIQAKNAAGIALSQEDLDALDPDHPMRGINRRGKTASDIFT